MAAGGGYPDGRRSSDPARAHQAAACRSALVRLQGTVPSISISREKLRNVRTRTMMPSVTALFDRLVDRHRQHDVRDDEDLEAKQDRPSDFTADALVQPLLAPRA
jgi:hypothetical protein